MTDCKYRPCEPVRPFSPRLPDGPTSQVHCRPRLPPLVWRILAVPPAGASTTRESRCCLFGRFFSSFLASGRSRLTKGVHHKVRRGWPCSRRVAAGAIRSSLACPGCEFGKSPSPTCESEFLSWRRLKTLEAWKGGATHIPLLSSFPPVSQSTWTQAGREGAVSRLPRSSLDIAQDSRRRNITRPRLTRR